MITRTFLTKCNTIINDSTENFGLYPICMLNHGFIKSRVLISFDLDKIKSLSDDGVYVDKTKLKYFLKMYNCGSLYPKQHENILLSRDKNGIKKRANGFNIIAIRIPMQWERGNGFDYSSDVWFTGDSSVSHEGSNWYYSKLGTKWKNSGIYTDNEIIEEYQKFKDGESSIIVAEQHFLYGNEHMKLDITDYITNLLSSGDDNYGLCLAFAPTDENAEVEYTQYVGFFSDRTNTFYHPVIETVYADSISDDRNRFHIGKRNRLYLYSNIGGELKNLDETPICTIDGTECDVTHQSKGVYYADVKLSSPRYTENMIIEDIWSNIKYDGDELDDIYMEFVTLPSNTFFKLGKSVPEARKTTLVVNGIHNDEKLNRGEIREVSVDFMKPYSHKKEFINGKAYYRLYVMDGSKEVDVIEWDQINMCCDYNYFSINTSELLPQEYRIDIKVDNGRESLFYKNELIFKVISNSTNQRM